ncbi:hypothetical protein SAZ10_02540 [Mesorhizobium sp. BAC0120]|uniref:hypothetical protein n=1 Tax=Mesorhizobium sp. BAC0120 TaxID=3090670 RepID=UPI00298CB295|nr:hypothetical protein [Mesorhizobium sp. BAC0120]MDW6020635.1 hypothetical protein [Mesorhizobium sp. BAC0120]
MQPRELFRFLLSRVGSDWTDVHREAVSQLDDEEPIFWLVARNEAEKRASVRPGENSYYSGLYIDENNGLREQLDIRKALPES